MKPTRRSMVFLTALLIALSSFAQSSFASDCEKLTKNAQKLFDAVAANDLAKVQKLAPKVKLNAKYGPYGGWCEQRILPFAITQKGNGNPVRLEIVKALLKAGADANTAALSPFWWSDDSAKLIELMRVLVAAGIDLNVSYIGSGIGSEPHEWQGTTLLGKWAAKADLPELIQFLVAAGADVDGTFESFGTALSAAAARCPATGQKTPLATIRTLISLGAKLEGKSIYSRPLPRALNLGCLETAKRLIEAGADIQLVKSESPEMPHSFLNYALDRLAQGRIPEETVLQGIELLSELKFELNPAQNQPLVIAARYPFPALISLLIQKGAQVNPTPDWSSETPLTAAVQSARDSTEVIEILLKAGAKLDYRRHGVTVLHMAASSGHLNKVKTLLAAGLDVNTTADNGTTPLVAAIKSLCWPTHYRAEPPMIEYLLSRGADPKKADAFEEAVESRCGEKTIRLILQAGG